MADWVVRLDEGRVVVEGPVKEQPRSEQIAGRNPSVRWGVHDDGSGGDLDAPRRIIAA